MKMGNGSALYRCQVHSGPLRVLEVYGDPTDFGRSHGLECADLINKYLADRLGRSGNPTWAGRHSGAEAILDLAESIIPAHSRYSPALFEELEALAAAAGITVAEALVVGGFTDVVDLVRAGGGPAPIEDDCTVVIDPNAGMLAQTWDMHASAGEYVLMLKLDPIRGPGMVVQTTAGCLGQIGMNEAGIGVGINNLTSMGRVGVTWNFVVRKALSQSSLDDAVQCVVDAELAGGHNFAVIGPDGEGVNIEAMPGVMKVTRVSTEPFVHSNHCLDLETISVEAPRPYEYQENSLERLEEGQRLSTDIDRFFESSVISRRATTPDETATCGAVIMSPQQRQMKSVWGLPGEGIWEEFQL
jgi:isopenicillin-N N-acyltransferase-like protein